MQYFAANAELCKTFQNCAEICPWICTTVWNSASHLHVQIFHCRNLHPGYLWELSSVERTVSLDFAKSLFWSKTPSNIFWKLVLLQSRWLSGLAFGVVYSHWPRTADSVSIWWLPVHRHSACNQWLYRHWWLIFFIYF